MSRGDYTWLGRNQVMSFGMIACNGDGESTVRDTDGLHSGMV